MKWTASETFSVTLKMAGDIEDARRWLRTHFYNEGGCVPIHPIHFEYTGGTEAGFAMTFENYPRFPSTPEAVWSRATFVAEGLVVALRQKTALLIGPGQTRWLKADPPGARA